jgi:hypothetical protein
MSDIRKKVSMLQVMVDIKPYIINMIAMMTKRFVENVLKKGQKIERTFIDLGMIKLMSIWTAMAELPAGCGRLLH